MKLVERMARSVNNRRGIIVLRADFSSMGSQSQITAALKLLQKTGTLIRIGTAVYAKTRVSSITGALIPAGSLETLSLEALEKLGVDVRPGKAASDYNAGRTTQLPGTFILNTGSKRIRRKITVGGRNIAYENDIERTRT
jgi:hypothetical protein